MALLLFTFALAILFWKLIKQHANCDRKLFSNIRYPAMAHVLEYRIKNYTKMHSRILQQCYVYLTICSGPLLGLLLLIVIVTYYSLYLFYSDLQHSHRPLLLLLNTAIIGVK